MTKQVETVLADAVERLKSGETIERVLGSVAYEHGRNVREQIAGELRKLAIQGYANRTA